MLKSIEIINRQYKNGRIPWNKGLTKDDSRVKKYIRHGFKLSPETINKIKEARKKQIITIEHRNNIGKGIKKSKKYYESLKYRSCPDNSGQFKKGEVNPYRKKYHCFDTRKKYLVL